jgi:hypothetical protein
MVFNAIFNNISIIYPEKTIGLPQVTDKPRHEHDTNTNLVIIGTDYTGNSKSNYHTNTTAPRDMCILVYYLILKWWLRPSALFNRTYIYYVYDNFCVTKNKYMTCIMFKIIALFIIMLFTRLYVRVGILFTRGKHLHDRILSLRWGLGW